MLSVKNKNVVFFLKCSCLKTVVFHDLVSGTEFVVLVLVFVVPGAVFLVLVAVVACHYVYYH